MYLLIHTLVCTQEIKKFWSIFCQVGRENGQLFQEGNLSKSERHFGHLRVRLIYASPQDVSSHNIPYVNVSTFILIYAMLTLSMLSCLDFLYLHTHISMYYTHTHTCQLQNPLKTTKQKAPQKASIELVSQTSNISCKRRLQTLIVQYQNNVK